ncbi:MBL fold metallo-hydrolase [Aneurinibacillus terranovensis]|uniref:MBL fold metallo-hydrolase n=1 Tax=Aneurinibacillus terranovensis TaxID=278991 RepID=UPI00048173A8|nr:MBL fold metallo-hydrolase [Aneurinibacillus terranovensis]
MKIQFIRHATMMICTENKKIIVDPMFSPAGTMSAIPDVPNKANNPLVDLPCELSRLTDIDAILITHTHRDHFDDLAVELLPKNVPLFCQPEDAEKIHGAGFLNIKPVHHSYTWDGLTIYRTGGQHGTGEIGQKMGPVSGFVLCSIGDLSLYIIGDSIWCNEVERALNIYRPHGIVCFAGAAQFSTGEPITMTAQDVHQVCLHAPRAKVFAAHMDTWNHCSLSRQELREYIRNASLTRQVFVPNDGDLLQL